MSLMQKLGYAADAVTMLNDEYITMVVEEHRRMAAAKSVLVPSNSAMKQRFGNDTMIVLSHSEFLGLLSRIDYAEKKNMLRVRWTNKRAQIKRKEAPLTYTAVAAGNTIYARVRGSDPADDFYGRYVFPDGVDASGVLTSTQSIMSHVEANWMKTYMQISSFEVGVDVPQHIIEAFDNPKI